jgi:glutamine amidotransferase
VIAINDYGMGNLMSVINACVALGAEATLARRPEDLKAAARVILPGVGAFGDGMRNLRAAGWVEAMHDEVRGKGKPFLGICLGMQLLATRGTEHGLHEGLGWIDGVADALHTDDPRVRIPHIGWNDVTFTRRQGLYAGLAAPQSFYFVHSYVLRPQDASLTSGVCVHGEEFPASIEAPPIFGTQYHPEKSQKPGMRVLRNFLEMRC